MKGTDLNLFLKMTEYEYGNTKQIQHFTKVYTFAKMMGELEGLDEKKQHILCTTALVHDIGIKKAIEVYGSSNGAYQEELGPAIAEQMLRDLGYEQEVTRRVSYLVGHHHTYKNIDDLDYQILVEADFLVNLYENQSGEQAILNAYQKIFRTESGKKLCREMFALGHDV